MTKTDLLRLVLAAADDVGRIFDHAEISTWPAGSLVALGQLGLLRQAATGLHAPCPNCDDGHIEPVTIRPGTGDAKRYFIWCPETMRVEVTPEMCNGWEVDRAGLAAAIAVALGITQAPKAVIPERFWRLGRTPWPPGTTQTREVVLALRMRDQDASAVAAHVGPGGRAIVLVHQHAPDERIWSNPAPAVVPLVEVLSLADTGLIIDAAAVVEIVRATDERASKTDAAELSGTDMGTLEVGLKRMQKTLYQAATGSKQATEALGQLGLTVEDLRGLSPDQQFKLIADKLAAIQSPAVRAALAMQIFGRSGTELLPMMSKGAAGIEAMEEEARKLGLTATDTGVAVGVKLEESLTTLWKVLKKLAAVLGSAIAPLLTDVANWIIDVVVQAIAWVKQNKELILTIFKIAAIVVAAGLALMGLGYAISMLGTVMTGLATIIGVVSAGVGILIDVVAAFLNPVGLVIVAVAALGAYLIYASGMGGKALSWLGERFTDLWGFASEAFGGIADALAAGDIALAAKILWLTLKLAWIKGVQILESVWLNFSNFFIKIAYDAFYGAQAAWEIVQDALCVAWIETTAFLSNAWTSFTSGFEEAWNTAVNWTTKGILELQSLFDDDLDVDSAKKMADDDLAATNNEVERQKNAAIAEREQQRKDERQMADEEHNHQMAQIGQESLDKEKALDDEYDQKMKAAQDEFDAAQKDWKDAIAKAHDEKKMKDAQGPERLEAPPALPDYLEGLGPTIKQAQEKTVGVHGTFNAMEAPGMRAGGVADRLAKATEETAKNTKKLVEQGEEDDAEFD